jgi:predicted metal-dependent phosphoesterase TrpH
MSPSRVVNEAREQNLDVIAVCDHNSGENVEAACRAGQETGVAVIGGMEICSREEAHVLGLFPADGSLARAQAVVYENLEGRNDAEFFGPQLVVDENDNVVRQNDRLLIGATRLGLDEVVELIHGFGGLAIASHVDRPSFSVLSQLGFFPPGLELDGVEVFFGEEVQGLPDGLQVISSSDAHHPGEIGRNRTRFAIEDGTVDEIGMALRGEKGRGIVTD